MSGSREVQRLPGRTRAPVAVHELKLDFDEFWALSAEEADAYLEDWCERAYRTQLAPLQDFVDSVDKHRDGVLRWFQTRVNSGVLEAINSLV